MGQSETGLLKAGSRDEANAITAGDARAFEHLKMTGEDSEDPKMTDDAILTSVIKAWNENFFFTDV